MIKNIFNFIYKYRIIVILFLLVLILVVLKTVTNQNSTQSSSNLTPIPTISLNPTSTQTGYIIDINGNKKISLDELKAMDNKTRDDYYINNLTEEERQQIPEDYFEP